MAISIHPHKGYLNTDFHIHYHGEENMSYIVISADDNSSHIDEGRVFPNKPHKLKINYAGKYEVRFENGQTISLVVEDAYKFGGSKLKNAIVFDSCPWLFVVMYDRTYFHNRVTGEEYLETISPDKIIEVSDNHVLFETNGQNESTLYSLVDQKPIAEFQDIIAYNPECIVFEENDEDKTYICVYSITKDERVVKIAVDDYEVFGNELFFYHRNLIQKLSLSGEFQVDSLLLNHIGLPITFINKNLVATYRNRAKRTLFLYSIKDGSVVGKIDIKGYLHSVNDKTIFNIYDRRIAINRFNINQSCFPEATIMVQYEDVEIFDCDWNVFYRIKSSKLTKTPHRMIEEEISFTFDSCGEDADIHLSQSRCDVFVHHKSLMVVTGNTTYLITPNSTALELKEGKYDKDKFEISGIIQNSVSGESIQLKKEYLSKEARFIYFESEGYTDLQTMGYKYRSSKDNYAIEIERYAIYLVSRRSDSLVKTSRILEKHFDYSDYKNVLFSEDGSKVMHRSGKSASVIDITSGEEQTYPNLSYVLHVNGIRPSFDIDKKRQVVIDNPITGEHVPSDTISSYSFISPDGLMYADANLKSYIEWHYRIDDRLLSVDEYNALLAKYSYGGDKSSDTFKTIKVNRERIVRENLSHFKQFAKNTVKRSDKEWINYFVDEEQIWSNEHFMNYIVEERGVAVIKHLSNDSEIARINLGKPLWYLNYVSFSYDGKYVAIAGRYPDHTHDEDGNSLGGLFLCFDLINKTILFKKTDSYAVWLTAFTKSGELAAYSSNPITFIVHPGHTETTPINGYSFLTFSPDGRYFALSKKGYVRKDSNRSNWGHQKSTDVFLCATDNPEEIVCSYNDLDGEGIDNLASLVRRNKSIASVAFSKNNKHLLMVGEDGVMIIRNLHLDDYATE